MRLFYFLLAFQRKSRITMEQLWEELQAAVLEGDLSKVTRLLKAFDLIQDSKICTRSMTAKRAKLNMMTKQMQFTLLDIAIYNDHLNIVKLFLDKKFTLEFEKSDGHNDIKMFDYNVPLLHTAVNTGNKSLVELLLKSGADVNEKALTSRCTCSKGCFRPESKTAAIHFAAKRNYEEIVSVLLEYGASVATLDLDKQNAMHFAAAEGNLSMTKFLFNLDPLIFDCYSEYGHLPLHHAAICGHKEVVLFLLNHPYGDLDRAMRGTMAAACRNGHTEIVEILLNRGFEINNKLNSYYTALHTATTNKQYKVVKFLLDQGANVHEKTTSGNTALFLAVQYCNVEITELLLQYGADVFEYCNGESIILHVMSIYHPCEEILEVLLFHQADPHFKDRFGRTPLQRAVTGSFNHFNDAFPLIKWTVKKYFGCTDVCAEHLSTISNHLNLVTYWNNCVEEMKIVTEEIINNTNVKFIDIMESQSPTRLASYAGNQNIIEAFSPEALKSKFPIYGGIMKKDFEKGIARRKLQDTARRSFCALYDKNDQKLPQLPIIFIDRVISHLSNKDLINFTQ